ncbi:hypothetical protein [Methanobacterium sp. ACI-7]|uniref:hypothetical protein n=1 Tax=unclassified Methanobacterium TaxID=2627676 RepID=UPI0039C280FC
MLNELITKINQKINIAAIYIGLVISLIVPVIGLYILGPSLLTGEMQIVNVIYYIFPIMVLFGGFITSLLCCKKYSDGLINGVFLGLIFVFNLALIIGIIILVLMTVIGAVAPLINTLNSLITTLNSITSIFSQNTSLLGTISFDFGAYLLSIFLLTILILILGAVGGWLGVWLKNILKST